jgi:hypothetical protein
MTNIQQTLFDMNVAERNYKQAMLYAPDDMHAVLHQLDNLELDYVPRDQYEANSRLVDELQRANSRLADDVLVAMRNLNAILATWGTERDMNKDAIQELGGILYDLETAYEKSEVK